MSWWCSEVLTAEVAAKTAAVAALERQLAEAQRDAERTRERLERELAEERATAKQHVADLTARTEDAERQLRVSACQGIFALPHVHPSVMPRLHQRTVVEGWRRCRLGGQ